MEPFRTVCIVSLQLLHIAKFSSQFNCIDCHFQVSAAKLACWPSIKMMQFWIFQPVCCLTSSSVESVQQFQVYFFSFLEIISIKDNNQKQKKAQIDWDVRYNEVHCFINFVCVCRTAIVTRKFRRYYRKTSCWISR